VGARIGVCSRSQASVLARIIFLDLKAKLWDFTVGGEIYLTQKDAEMRRFTILLTAVAFVIAGGCGKESPKEEKEVEQPLEGIEVVATTGMIADIVKNVGGHFVNVTTLLGPDDDPHLYKPSKNDIDRMLKADIVFYNGLGLEAEMTAMLERMRNQVRTEAVTGSIDTTMLLRLDEPNGGYDPHVWLDIRMWMIAVEHVRNALSDIDRGHAEVFLGDAEVYMDQLSELHDYVYNEAQFIPVERRVLITAHHAFNYFGRAYGFDVRAPQGISTHAGAESGDIEDVARFITAHKIPVIFAEKSVPQEGIEAVKAAVAAKGFDIEIGGHLYSDATGDPGTPQGTYIGMVQHNIQTIVLALTGERDTAVP